MDLNPVEGILRVSGQAYVLLRPEILVNIQKQLEETVGASSKGFLYLAGERSARGGLHLVPGLTEDAGPEGSPEDALRRILDVLALLGWGRLALSPSPGSVSRYHFLLENSPIATFYGPSRKPVCHFLAGWLAGIVHTLVGEIFLCEETGCKAQGRPRCEFVLRALPTPRPPLG